MARFSSKFRIGEKLGLGFALVGLLFVGVVWHYQQTLGAVLDDHRQLHDVFEHRKSLAFEIEIDMAAAMKAEQNFLGQRSERFADEVDVHLRDLRKKVALLAAVDEQSRQTAAELDALTTTYETAFHAVVDAWRSMGLDENSGLQGHFRQKIHRLHDLSGNYNVDRLLTTLLQIRRSEKDLALRGDPKYRDRVRKLIADFRQLIENSALQPVVKEKLLTELGIYARTFEPYAEGMLRTGNPDGGKGPFRDAAHRIEAILDAHHVSNLETSVLALRRSEKDFLLRGGESYARRVVDTAGSIRAQIAASTIADADKALLAGLLRDYQDSFLALVSRRATIADLIQDMDGAASRVVQLIQQNVAQADQLMADRVSEINESSQASIRRGLIVVAVAIALATLFSVMIARSIVRPVRQMAGLLDDLAFGTPTGRVPTVAGGRDEINAMGESLNALIDHRANFLGWWKASMDEVTALRNLAAAADEPQRDEANKELYAAEIAIVQRINAIRGRLLQYSERLVEVAQRAREGSGRLGANDAKELEHSARGVAVLLEALATESTLRSGDSAPVASVESTAV